MSRNHLAVSHNRRSRRKLRYAAVAGAATAGLLNAHALFAQPVFPPDVDAGYTFTAASNDVWSDNSQWDPGDSSNLPPVGGGQNVAVWLNPSGGTGTTVTLDSASTPGGTYQLNSLWLGGTNNAPLTLVGDNTNPSLVFGPNSNNYIPTITLAGSSTNGVTIATPISLSNMSLGQALTFNSVTNAAGVYNTLAILGAISGTGDLSFQTAGCGTGVVSLTIAGNINNNGNVTFSSSTTNTSNLVITGALANTGTLYFNNPGTLSYTNGAGIPSSVTTLTVTSNVGAVTIAGNIANANDAIFDPVGTVFISGNLTNGGNVTFGGTVTGVSIGGNISNGGSLSFNGNVTLAGIFEESNSIYTSTTGYTFTNTGTLDLLNSGSFASPGPLAFGTAGTALSITIAGNITSNVGSLSFVNHGGVTMTGGIANNGSITFGTNVVNTVNGNYAGVSITGEIQNTGAFTAYSQGFEASNAGGVLFAPSVQNVSIASAAFTTGVAKNSITLYGAIANTGSLSLLANASTGSLNLFGNITTNVGNVTLYGDSGVTVSSNIANIGYLSVEVGTNNSAVSLGLVQTAGNITIGGSTINSGSTLSISTNALNVSLQPNTSAALNSITNTGNIYIGNGTSAGKITISGPLNATGNIYIQSGTFETGTTQANLTDTNAQPGGGNWFLSGGALIINYTNAAWVGASSSSVFTWTGGNLSFPEVTKSAYTFLNPINLGGSVGWASQNDNALTLSGPITVTAPSTMTAQTYYETGLYFPGVLSGSNSLTIGQGTIEETVTLEGGAPNTITGALNMYGAGKLNLSMTGAYNAFNGSMTIGNGVMLTGVESHADLPSTVAIGTAHQQIPLGSSNVVYISGAAANPGASYSAVPGVLNLAGNSQSINQLQGYGIIGSSSGSPVLTLAPSIPDTFNGVITNSVPTAAVPVSGTNATLTYTTGSLQVDINGTALQTLAGANLYNLGTLIVTNSAGLQITNAQALGSGSVTVSAPFINNFAGSLTNTVNLVTGGTIYGVGGSGFTGFSGTVLPNGGSVNLTDYVTSAPLNLTMSGPVTGTGLLVVTGTSGASGILNLSGADTYTGGTKVLNGTLQAGTGAALGFGTLLTSGQSLANATTTVTNGGALDLNGQNITEPTTLSGGILTNSNANPATLNNGVLGTTFSAASTIFSSSSQASFGGGGAAAQIYVGFTTASISIQSGGAGYVSAPTVTINNGTNAGIILGTLTATTNAGQVTKFTVTVPGDYTPAEMAGLIAMGTNAITISGGGASTPATAEFVDSHFVMDAIQQTAAGTGYGSTASASITGGGSAALNTTYGTLALAGNNTFEGAGNINIAAAISGNGNFNLIGTNTVTLTNPKNSLAGGFTLTSGALTAQSALGYGSVLGTSAANAGPINLAGGTLAIYDDGGPGGVSGTILNYRNAINAVSSSTLSVNPVSSGSNNTIALGVLTFTTANNPTLTLTNGNNYGVSFTGITGGGTLSGATPVSVAGVVQPGDGPAILNVNNLSLASSGTFAAEITGPGWQSPASTNAGINYDQINVTGASALSVGADTVLNILLGSTNVAGNYYLVNESASSNPFGAVDFNGTLVTPDINGNYDYTYNSVPLIFTLSYNGNFVTGDGHSGYDVTLETYVPEPSSLGLLALGSMGLLARRRRRTPKKAD